MQTVVTRSRTILALGLTLLWQNASAAGQGPSPDTSSRSVLVELFTSEGCSSCPPADAFLQQINGQHLASGEFVVGLSEHVTYWNHLGWSDPFSSDVFTERQSAYSDRFGAGSVYTPQMVVNGAREAVGSDRNAVLEAIRSSAASTAASGVRLSIKSAVRSGDGISITYSASLASSAPGNADVFAVIADDLRQSRVVRGENTGRTLAHVAVARSLTHIARLESGDSLTVHLPLPATAGALSRHLVLFAQARGPGRVLAIDMKPIDGPSGASAAFATQATNPVSNH